MLSSNAYLVGHASNPHGSPTSYPAAPSSPRPAEYPLPSPSSHQSIHKAPRAPWPACMCRQSAAEVVTVVNVGIIVVARA
ncbi:hypothetical protein BOTBODRAFT_439731 [Botryobasidium botryosum FD-172 SS1]|uniref:Uncharacterized protein n=1 Tax=Botryobasidium botryosum (strain FD-172 SS1) TaxID=930990 RepID=A0A067N5Q4_BOTB1|nr:hypothetical protein BOTBODRAFT_439731 [Botryobasidium botryosum FD-172 SS1]